MLTLHISANATYIYFKNVTNIDKKIYKIYAQNNHCLQGEISKHLCAGNRQVQCYICMTVDYLIIFFSPLFRVAHVFLVDCFAPITQTMTVKQKVLGEMYYKCVIKNKAMVSLYRRILSHALCALTPSTGCPASNVTTRS